MYMDNIYISNIFIFICIVLIRFVLYVLLYFIIYLSIYLYVFCIIKNRLRVMDTSIRILMYFLLLYSKGGLIEELCL